MKQKNKCNANNMFGVSHYAPQHISCFPAIRENHRAVKHYGLDLPYITPNGAPASIRWQEIIGDSAWGTASMTDITVEQSRLRQYPSIILQFLTDLSPY